MFRGMFFRGAAVMGALSAIDVALWDIAGKYYNVPVYQLMGGKCRDKVLVYGHVIAASDEELVENCKKRREQGFKAVGHLSPFLDEDEDLPYNRTYIKNMEDAIRRTHLMREAVGDDMDLCIELHRRSLPAEAVVLIHEIADVHPLFVEDPIPPGNNEAMAYVVRHSNVPVATGERLHTLYEFQDRSQKSPCAGWVLPRSAKRPCSPTPGCRLKASDSPKKTVPRPRSPGHPHSSGCTSHCSGRLTPGRP